MLGSKMRGFRGVSKKPIFWPFSLRKMDFFDPYAEDHTKKSKIHSVLKYRNNIKIEDGEFFCFPKKLFFTFLRAILDFRFCPKFWGGQKKGFFLKNINTKKFFLDRFFKNSCMYSASIWYSQTPGFTKFKIRLKPFSVIWQAVLICCSSL